MARGWESKAVESQIESAASKHHREAHEELTQAQVAQLREKESLQLSITRTRRQLETVRNPRYRVMLEQALGDLEKRLSQMG